MKTLEVNADQIITLNDYPVHSEKVLIKYFNKCKEGEKTALVPVVKKDFVKKYLTKVFLQSLQSLKKKILW